MNDTIQKSVSKNEERLKNFPISFFSIIMGLSGFTIVWQKIFELNELPVVTTDILAWLTFSMFLGISGIYLAKMIKLPNAVIAELKHPVKLSFFPAFSIGMLLLAIVMISVAPLLSEALWIIGTIVHFMLFLFVVNSWMHHEHYQIQHISPAWFIPAVGNVLVPVAGMHFGYVEISWFFFSIGMMFWIILFTIFFYRIMFHNPLPTHLVPTFFILIAPPTVGFVAYVKLNSGLDNFANILYYMGLFLTILLFSQARRFASLPFFLSWWAYSFPIAAITIASFVMHHLTQKILFLNIAGILSVILTAVIALIVFKTVKAVRAKKICVEMH
ncbi:MAG: SLAC1 anion channel family protein [Gammaproteobacteria bacterium]